MMKLWPSGSLVGEIFRLNMTEESLRAVESGSSVQPKAGQKHETPLWGHI